MNCGEDQSELTKGCSMETSRKHVFDIWTVINGRCVLPTQAPWSLTHNSEIHNFLNKLFGGKT